MSIDHPIPLRINIVLTTQFHGDPSWSASTLLLVYGAWLLALVHLLLLLTSLHYSQHQSLLSTTLSCNSTQHCSGAFLLLFIIVFSSHLTLSTTSCNMIPLLVLLAQHSKVNTNSTLFVQVFSCKIWLNGQFFSAKPNPNSNPFPFPFPFPSEVLPWFIWDIHSCVIYLIVVSTCISFSYDLACPFKRTGSHVSSSNFSFSSIQP